MHARPWHHAQEALAHAPDAVPGGNLCDVLGDKVSDNASYFRIGFDRATCQLGVLKLELLGALKRLALCTDKTFLLTVLVALCGNNRLVYSIAVFCPLVLFNSRVVLSIVLVISFEKWRARLW